MEEVRNLIEHPDTKNTSTTCKLRRNSNSTSYQLGFNTLVGLWEARVNSMKLLLQKHLTLGPLAHDELDTVLVEVEAILNFRPVRPVSTTDPDAPEI